MTIRDVLIEYGLSIVKATNDGRIQAGMYRDAVIEELNRLAVPAEVSLRQYTANPSAKPVTKPATPPLDAVGPTEGGKGKISTRQGE